MDIDRLKILQEDYNFLMPNLVPDTVGRVRVNQVGDEILLSVDDVNWMVLNLRTFREVYELFSHIFLSKGLILCSGMGLLLRESWLVNLGFHVTVVESNLDVINYHKKHNSEICSNMTIIHDDIHNISGKYDTLLLDHYEHESQDEILRDVNLITQNIKCDVLWFWPLERFIGNYHYQNNRFDFYKTLKSRIPNLPDITEEILSEFVDRFHLN